MKQDYLINGFPSKIRTLSDSQLVKPELNIYLAKTEKWKIF